jgi:hypothetical protein
MPSLPLLLAFVTATAPGAPPQPAADLEKDKAAITQAARDYAEGYYEGSGERMARAVSPMLTKRGLRSRPGVDSFLVQMNAEMLIEAARGGRGKLDPEKRNLAVKVLAVDGDVASAQVFTSQFNDYLHLVKRDGEWRLVSVLWHAPVKDAAAAPDADRQAVEQTVKKLVEAMSAGDAAGLESVLHPVLAWRYFAQMGADGRRLVVDENAESLEAAAAGGQKAPLAPDGVKVEVLGVDYDIASVKLTTPDMPVYLHLAKQKEGWRVVNALGCPPAQAGQGR